MGELNHTTRLSYTAPYHWQSTLDFLTKRAIVGVEYGDENSYQRTFEIQNQAGIVSVCHDADSATIKINIQCNDPPGAPSAASVASIITERLKNLFDTAADMAAIEKTFASDPALTGAMAGIRVPGCWDFFEIGVRAILGQQITVAAARTLAGRLCQRFGRRLPMQSGSLGYLFPTAEALAEADIVDIGMPQRRAECIRTFARALATGEISWDKQTEITAVEKKLLALRGIGQWTTGYLRMRAFKDADAFPQGDIALLNAAQQLGIAADAKQLVIAAERWRPYRAYAAVRLWRSLSAT